MHFIRHKAEKLASLARKEQDRLEMASFVLTGSVSPLPSVKAVRLPGAFGYTHVYRDSQCFSS